MMRLLLILISVIFLSGCGTYHKKEFLENSHFKLSIDKEGQLYELLEKKTAKNLLIPNYKVSFITIQIKDTAYPISSWKQKGNMLTFKFDEPESEICIEVKRKNTHLSFELIEIKSNQLIDKVVFGPYHVLPSEKIGQSIGIAYDDDIAIGFMGLNLKSRGGFEIIERQRFGNAAKKIEGGASLTGFVRDRSKYRIVDNWEQKLGQAVPVNDSDATIVGAKFAMYCLPSKSLTDNIEKIILAEDLPHIKNGVEWNKTSNYSTSSKFIMSFNVDNIDVCIDLAKKAGMTCLYHGGIFETWGTFKVNEKDFPKGYESVRACSDKAEAHGITLGAHTLTNFITPNDPLVTPKPHPGLVLAGTTPLEKDISETDIELWLLDETMRPAYHEPHLDKVNPRWRKHTAVRIGDEIIEYTLATSEGKLLLKDCQRGAFGTKAVSHQKGENVSRLMSHGYKVFFPDINLQDEMAKNLAKFFNEANLKRISFDGLEGGLATGHGRYGGDRFVKIFYDHLENPNIIGNSSDVTHFGWHYFSNESWGEPWASKNFREADLEHRINVQKKLKEDLLPRKMGQFSINERTTKKDIEWVMGLGAGFDAGLDFYISPDFETINSEAAEILAEIKKWEEARLKGLFSEEQKEKLRDPYTFYGLDVNDGKTELVFIESWKPEAKKEAKEKNSLSANILENDSENPISIDYKHINMTTEPGQPTASIWNYMSQGVKKLQYVIRLPKTAKEKVKDIYLKIGAQKIIMPFILDPGDYIVNKGNSTLQHYSENNDLKEELTLVESFFTLNSGSNQIECDYQGKGRMAGPEILVNFRTIK